MEDNLTSKRIHAGRFLKNVAKTLGGGDRSWMEVSRHKEELALFTKGEQFRQSGASRKLDRLEQRLWRMPMAQGQSSKVKEGIEQGLKEETQMKPVVQSVMLKCTDSLTLVIAPSRSPGRTSQGVVSLSYVCHHCNSFPREDFMWWVSTGHGRKKMKQCSWWCVAVAASTMGETLTDFW